MDGGTREDFEIHMSECASCARYDRLVGSGSAIYRDLTDIEPASDFLPRLQHRIFHIDEESARLGRRASGTSVIFTTAIAGMIGLAAWAPLVRPVKTAVELPPIAAHAPHPEDPTPVLFRSGPLLQDRMVDLYGRVPVRTVFFEYSPLGAQGQVRTASSR